MVGAIDHSPRPTAPPEDDRALQTQVEALAVMVRNKLNVSRVPATMSEFARLFLGFNEDDAPYEFMEMNIAMRRLLIDFDVALDAWAADQIMKAKEAFGQDSPTDS